MDAALPRTFEEFDEARRQAFVRVMDYKRTGGRLVGYLCSYTPLEVIDAAGAAAVGLCGTSPETIPAAEAVLPANLCPLVKSTYGRRGGAPACAARSWRCSACSAPARLPWAVPSCSPR